MAKQSYVKLDHFFEIETKYLESFRGGSIRLDRQSIDNLTSCFQDLLDGRIASLARSKYQQSPLWYRKFTLQQLGVQQPTATTIRTSGPICPPSNKRKRDNTTTDPLFVAPAKKSKAIPFIAPSARAKQHAMTGNWRQAATAA